MMKSYPLTCLTWGNTFAEEFLDPALNGWTTSLASGQKQVSDSVIHLWTLPFMDRFPLLWRNDIFQGAGDDFAIEIRFRYSDIKAYGTTIALNSAPYDGKRYPTGQPLPPGIEDVLNIHHVVDPGGNVYRFNVSLFQGKVAWYGTPGDSNWHIARITVEPSGKYTLYVDGQYVGETWSSVRPLGIYIGNPTIQPFYGAWTHLYVDYIRVSRCLVWGPGS